MPKIIVTTEGTYFPAYNGVTFRGIHRKSEIRQVVFNLRWRWDPFAAIITCGKCP